MRRFRDRYGPTGPSLISREAELFEEATKYSLQNSAALPRWILTLRSSLEEEVVGCAPRSSLTIERAASSSRLPLSYVL